MGYTKGPWFVDYHDDDPQEIYISAPNGDLDLGYTKWSGLASVWGNDDMPEVGAMKALDNARLIASAPELLEALQYAVEVFEIEVPMGNPTIEMMKQAIAKATGKPA